MNQSEVCIRIILLWVCNSCVNVLYRMVHRYRHTGIHTVHTRTHARTQRRIVKKHVKSHSKWNEQSSRIKYNQHDSGQHAHTHSHRCTSMLFRYTLFLFWFRWLRMKKKYQLNSTDDLLMVYLTVMFYFSNWHFQESEQQLLFSFIHSTHWLLYFPFGFHFPFHSRTFFFSPHFILCTCPKIWPCPVDLFICIHLLLFECVSKRISCVCQRVFACMCSLLSADHFQISLQI